MDMQTEEEFTAFLLSKAAEAKREVGFPGTKFVKDLRADGGYQTVLRLLHKKDLSDGFTDLCMRGRTDLTVEAIIVESKWRNYFDKVLIDKAEARLTGAKYAFKRYQDSMIAPASVTVTQQPTSPASMPPPLKTVSRRYWWVNQNQTYKSEIPGGFMWSPKTTSNGRKNQFYDNMCEVTAGDIVFSFCKGLIKALGVVEGPAQTAPKPDFGNAGASWAAEGWLVPVDFTELQHQIRPKHHIDHLIDHLPEKYSPLTEFGNGLQSVYLAEVPPVMAATLAELIGAEYTAVLRAADEVEENIDEADDRAEEGIRGRTDIGPTEKKQLAKSRRGQGLFKANVRLNEKACRVTGVTDVAHLRASHIKPWRVSDDHEKLDGCNGLLLAPHVDHLFDRGFISFTQQGDLLVSAKLPAAVLNSWGIVARHNVGPFSGEQAHYLEYHRQNIFKG